tara:strand:- start:182 stop:1003 length:822 start_codon:yes stop_codon:yes gene_type:complete
MRRKIFFTGSSGFAGKLITKYLERKNLKIAKIVFNNPKHKKNIKIDLTKKIYLKKNFSWIIHAAAHHKIEDFKSKAKCKAKRNILMVKNLVDFAKKNKVKNFIYFSTIDINYSPYPSKKNIYIKSKTFCEKILLTALKRKILKKLIILRLPAIVGKQSNDNFIINTLYNLKKNLPINIWNKNDKYNNLIHINDLSKLIFYFIYNKNKIKKTIIDCLSSKPIKLEDLINNLKKKLNSKSKVNYINKKNKFKRIEFNSKTYYKFFSVKKAINLLI